MKYWIKHWLRVLKLPFVVSKCCGAKVKVVSNGWDGKPLHYRPRWFCIADGKSKGCGCWCDVTIKTIKTNQNGR